MSYKVRVCVASYLNDQSRIPKMFCLVYSLLSQTHQNIEIIIHHDGPIDDNTLKTKIESISKNIKVLDNLDRKGAWGHYHRWPTATYDDNADWVIFTNDDNYYAPTFIEVLLNHAIANNSEFVYCDHLHNGLGYYALNAYPTPGLIDMGAFIASMNLVKETSWDDYIDIADGIYAKKLADKTNPVKAPGILFIHN